MRLTDLDASLRKLTSTDRCTHSEIQDVASADGVLFQCPKCFVALGGAVGCHYVLCWSPKVPDDVVPKPGRWNLVGTSLADLTLVAGSSSVLLVGGCAAHFFVRNGEIVDC